MQSRRVITIVLLLFVAVSVGVLAGKSMRPDVPAESGPAEQAAATQPAREVEEVVVYYFHGDVRCQTCNTIERLSRTAVEAGFAKEIEQGRLRFKAINTDEPENAHYRNDYELTSKMVVAANYRGGEQTRWKKLGRVWELVGDEPTFVAYVRDEVAGYLEPR